jgi:hypothetical protein
VSRSLLKKGEELLKESKLPKSFLGDAVQMANQTRNREESADSKSAWEKFDGNSSWKAEHDFGEKVEFSVGGEQGLFLGYAGQDGRTFKILRLKDRKVIVCKDVKFAKKPKGEGDDLTADLEMELQKSSEDIAEAVTGARTGGADRSDKAVGAGAVRRSDREHKPPDRLTLFAGSKSVMRL